MCFFLVEYLTWKVAKNHKRRNVTDHIVRTVPIALFLYKHKNRNRYSDDSVLFWMKCLQLPYETMSFWWGQLPKNHEKCAKNHKRRNVTDHIVRNRVLCFSYITKNNDTIRDCKCVLFWMK